jgi:hypothetical protein
MAIRININDLNPGAWFDFRDGVKVKVRPFAGNILDDIRKKATQKKVEYKKQGKIGRLQRIEYIDLDEDKMQALLWDYIIVDWDGIEDDKGKAIKCDKKNKVRFMQDWPEFYDFIDNAADVSIKDVEQHVEDVEKN